MNFYKSVFGGNFAGKGIMRMGDAPGMSSLSEEEKNRVMHISLPLNNASVLMASDRVPYMWHKLVIGNNN